MSAAIATTIMRVRRRNCTGAYLDDVPRQSQVLQAGDACVDVRWHAHADELAVRCTANVLRRNRTAPLASNVAPTNNAFLGNAAGSVGHDEVKRVVILVDVDYWAIRSMFIQILDATADFGGIQPIELNSVRVFQVSQPRLVKRRRFFS